ncbi:MAG: tetratricopeptide repeat protein [Candidatus Aminicenantes bacterium]|nr:tetratricopeptide repeat protein [Candidatus Aminicenantes bacterium]
MKRVFKKQLKEDELVSTMTKVVNFVKGRTREIMLVAIGLAFLFLLYLGLRFIQAQNVDKESRILSQILALRTELKTNPEKREELRRLAGQGKFRRLAYVLEATHWVEQGELEKAEEALTRIAPKTKDFIYYQAQDLLGQIHFFRENHDQAIAVFQKIEEEKPEAYGLDVILYHKAEALEAKGDKEAALAVYKAIREKFPQSYYGYDASERARKIESAAPPSL